MRNLVLFGPPGAGKGTQSAFLVNHFNLIHLSTGDVFRLNIKGGTELGNLAKSYMNKGQLVPDEVTISMLEAEVNKHENAKGFIFDGFPRTEAQAEALDAFLAKTGDEIEVAKPTADFGGMVERSRGVADGMSKGVAFLLKKNKVDEIEAMLALEVEEGELKKRLLARAETSGRADDADPEVIQNRINVYNAETAPVANFYKSAGKFKSIDGQGSIEDITLRLVDAIG